MKKFVTVLFFVIAIIFTVDAQKMSKKEKKKIKKELKQYRKNPENFVKMQESKSEEIESLSEQVAEKRNDLDQKDNLIGELNDTITALRIKNVELQNKASGTDHPEMGYRVQIGYYKVFDLNKYLLGNPKDIYSEKVDGANRYSVGYFDNLEEARSFRNDLRKMGIKDAFVSQYQNGNRNMEFDDK